MAKKRVGPEEGRGKKPKTSFFYFSLSAEGVLPKDRFEFLSPDGSRWRPQSEKGGFPQEFLKKKPLISKGKQAFVENRSFASTDGWGTSSGRLGATPTGPGGDTARLKKSMYFQRRRKKCFLKLRRDPRVPPRWPQDRLTSFSPWFLRRLESLHFYNAKGLGSS